jgi:uncharacterized protein (TIGR02757 family)
LPPYAVMGQRKPTVKKRAKNQEEKSQENTKTFLDEKVAHYNGAFFIEADPISIPHLFSKKEDREIAGFFAATIAWGQRITILKNARSLVEMMDNSPHKFITSFQDSDLNRFKKFIHRTFNSTDCIYFFHALKNIYLNHGGLEKVFHSGIQTGDLDLKNSIIHTRKIFFELDHLKRTEKHFSNPAEGSAAKRINMFLRWMVRNDNSGVDFGIWKSISPALLSCPLDVHSGRVARKLGLLKRKQNDWKAVEELTANLRGLDPVDPCKYDIALFGLGVFEKF